MSNYETDYTKFKARYLAILEGVNNADSQFEMYSYATSTWPKFCKEMLKVVLELENAYGEQYGLSREAIAGIKDDDFLNN